MRLSETQGIELLTGGDPIELGIRADEMETLARNAHKTMSNLFAMDRYTLSLQETVDIFNASYR